MMSVVMLMLALAPLSLFKEDSGGLLVVLADVRQQGLYLPVEAVPPQPTSLCSFKSIACPQDSPQYILRFVFRTVLRTSSRLI
jgi:hypothetical protein